jgi:Ca2+-binding RTX toxin-like protein
VAGSTLLGAAGGLNVLDTGTGDTIAPGSASAAVTLDGSGALVSGALGPVSVLDNGTSDTINASSSLTTITAPGGSFVNGGSGSLNFVGGAAPSTILGGSGDSTVFGGTGLTSLVGGAGGAVTYVNTTAGALFFGGRNGDETVDASLSRGTNTLYGALDATGRNLLIGGAGDDFINAGSGADTLVGGGGENEFFFWSNFGGPSANHTIGDFSAIDTVVLANYSPGEAAAAIAGATTSGGSTTITLSDNTKITFTGVISPAALIGHIVS